MWIQVMASSAEKVSRGTMFGYRWRRLQVTYQQKFHFYLLSNPTPALTSYFLMRRAITINLRFSTPAMDCPWVERGLSCGYR